MVGTAVVLAAAACCIATRSQLPAPADEAQMRKLAYKIGGLVGLTVLLQRNTGFLLGGLLLDGNLKKALPDYAFNMMGSLPLIMALVIAVFAAGACGPRPAPRQNGQQNNAGNARLPVNPAVEMSLRPSFSNRNARLARAHGGVHVLDNVSLARQQLVRLKALSAQTVMQSRETDETIWARINVSLALTDPTQILHADGDNGTTYNIKDNARQFLNSLNDYQDTFNAEFGDLEVTPKQVVAMVWRVVMANAMEQDSTNEAIREATAQQLIDQCARISTSIHGGNSEQYNPCGSGKVSSLLQFANTMIPELDLFAGTFETLPENQVIQNEFFASFARDVKYLLEHPETLYDNAQIDSDELDQSVVEPTEQQIKAHLSNIYVDQDKKMTIDVFKQLYQGYVNALDA